MTIRETIAQHKESGMLVAQLELLKLVMLDARCQRAHRLVAVTLVEYASPKTHTAWIGLSELSAETGYSKQTVKNTLAEMKSWGFLISEKIALEEAYNRPLVHYTFPVATKLREMRLAVAQYCAEIRAKEVSKTPSKSYPPKGTVPSQGYEIVPSRGYEKGTLPGVPYPPAGPNRTLLRGTVTRTYKPEGSEGVDAATVANATIPPSSSLAHTALHLDKSMEASMEQKPPLPPTVAPATLTSTQDSDINNLNPWAKDVRRARQLGSLAALDGSEGVVYNPDTARLTLVNGVRAEFLAEAQALGVDLDKVLVHAAAKIARGDLASTIKGKLRREMQFAAERSDAARARQQTYDKNKNAPTTFKPNRTFR